MALPIVILISGRGSNMRALIEQSHASVAPYSVAHVLSDRADAAGLDTARDLSVAATALVKSKDMDRTAYDQILAARIEAYSPALIVLAGFMRILSAPFIERFAGRILNIHPSLLPKYPGLHTHRRALEAHESRHGATVHFVTEQLDGGPRVLQAQVDVEPGETEASLAAKVQVVEHRIFPMAVSWFCAGRLHCMADQAWLDGQPLVEPVDYSNSSARSA